MNFKKMDWKEIFKVSSIIGVVSYFLPVTLDSYGSSASLIVNPALGIIATGLVLSKKLDVNSSWGIYFGMILAGVFSIAVDFLLGLAF